MFYHMQKDNGLIIQNKFKYKLWLLASKQHYSYLKLAPDDTNKLQNNKGLELYYSVSNWYTLFDSLCFSLID